MVMLRGGARSVSVSTPPPPPPELFLLPSEMSFLLGGLTLSGLSGTRWFWTGSTEMVLKSGFLLGFGGLVKVL